MIRFRVTAVSAVLLVLGQLSPLAGQEISEKKEIAVFSLSYYDWTIPPGTLGLVDEQIKSVFVNLGRFDVIGMTYRLESSDVSGFIETIKEYKERNLEIPESVRLGKEAFTEADFNRLVGSFIVVVPVLSYFEVRRTDDGSIQAELRTSFTFINIEQSKTFAHVTVETAGSGTDAREAVGNASDAIPLQLTYEIRKLSEFQLKTGIIDIMRGEVLIEFGSDMGVKVGDEYAVIKGRVLPSGHTVTDETGLLLIREVKENVSIARILYSDGRLNIGDQLREVPRLGFETAVYAHTILDPSGTGTVVGFRQSVLRGFYGLRPFIGAELPLGFDDSIRTYYYSVEGLLANVYAGGELNWYLRRIQISPMIALGAGGFIPIPFEEDDEFRLSHLGGMVQLSVLYLVNRNIKVFVEGGGAQWFGQDPFGSYGGLYLGLGGAFKY